MTPRIGELNARLSKFMNYCYIKNVTTETFLDVTKATKIEMSCGL